MGQKLGMTPDVVKEEISKLERSGSMTQANSPVLKGAGGGKGTGFKMKKGSNKSDEKGDKL